VGRESRPLLSLGTGLMAYIVMACIVMADIVMA
jgi:hypothetical protein